MTESWFPQTTQLYCILILIFDVLSLQRIEPFRQLILCPQKRHLFQYSLFVAMLLLAAKTFSKAMKTQIYSNKKAQYTRAHKMKHFIFEFTVNTCTSRDNHNSNTQNELLFSHLNMKCAWICGDNGNFLHRIHISYIVLEVSKFSIRKRVQNWSKMNEWWIELTLTGFNNVIYAF